MNMTRNENGRDVELTAEEQAFFEQEQAKAALDAEKNAAREKITELESKISKRMMLDVLLGDSTTGLGADKDKTATQYVAEVRQEIARLRLKLQGKDQ